MTWKQGIYNTWKCLLEVFSLYDNTDAISKIGGDEDAARRIQDCDHIWLYTIYGLLPYMALYQTVNIYTRFLMDHLLFCEMYITHVI